MSDKVQDLRDQKALLLYEYADCKTQFIKSNIHRKIKAINVKLYKETKNPIYL
jgi:hypothetical protein